MRSLLLALSFVVTFSFETWAGDVFKGFEVLNREEKSLPTILVPPAKLLPTQLSIGQHTVNALVRERFGEKVFNDLGFKWDKKLELKKNLMSLTPEQLSSYVKAIQDKMNKKPFDGAYSVAGVFHFDGHHRSRALYEVNQSLSQVTQDLKSQILIPVRLIEDYSGKEWNDKKVAKDIFISKAQGYIPLSVFKKIPAKASASDIALMKYYYLRKQAPHLASLTDDPYRSLIGQALFEEKIESDTFVTYFEFYLEELLKEEIDKALLPVVLKPQQELSDSMVEKVKKILFSNPERIKKISYWARIDNLSKEEAFKRCLKIEEEVCKKNRLIFEKVSKKYQ